MARIYVDRKAQEADPRKNLLEVCLSLGFNLPYFCWHPALGSVGACRQCAVKQFKDENDERGRIVMACMTPAAEGTRVSIEDPEAKAFRAAVVEWLMVNHPHDCPVCDEGGECHLQDMTVMTGHAYRRFRFNKRTFKNQDLGPFINHEMNRCIQCYRCVRFYRDYAGGRDLHAMASHDHVYFGRHEDGALQSEFSGNLVEVCPTGVFTDKTLKRHYTRKWDLQSAPSVCVHCGLGCNTIAGERYGVIRRILNRYHEEVNGYFICDRGRFGYEFVNGPERIRSPLFRGSSGNFETVAKEKFVPRMKTLFSGNGRVIGIGSPRATLESNHALLRLTGRENFYAGMSDVELRIVSRIATILAEGPARAASVKDVERSDAVLVLGEDPTQVTPRLALALRQSARQEPMGMSDRLKIPRWHDAAVREVVQRRKGPLFIASPQPTRLDDAATEVIRRAPGDIARLGFAVAHAVDPAAPSVPDLSDDERRLAGAIAAALLNAKRPAVVSGPSLGSETILHAAANVAFALCEKGQDAALCFTMPECNSLGLALLQGKPLSEAFKALEEGGKTVVILENDLYRRADEQSVARALGSAAHVISLDSLENRTTSKADFVLPTATFAEGDGTLVNHEARAQRSYRVVPPNGEVREGWRWLRDLMVAAGRNEDLAWEKVDDVLESLSREGACFQRLAEQANTRGPGERLPRQPHRYSGRTAMRAHESVHEPQPPQDPDSPLTHSMEGFGAKPPAALIPFYWAPGWNSAQAVNKFQEEIGGATRGGEPGLRLIQPRANGNAPYFTGAPDPFRAPEGQRLVVPLYHIFGSEELSMRSPAVAARAVEPYVALSPRDLERLAIHPGDRVRIDFGDKGFDLPSRAVQDLPAGVAGLSAGLPGRPYLGLPRWGRISRSEEIG